MRVSLLLPSQPPAARFEELEADQERALSALRMEATLPVAHVSVVVAYGDSHREADAHRSCR